MSCFVLEIYDPPSRSTYIPQSVVGQDTSHLIATQAYDYRKDPAIGLRVIITGRHPLHGLNGVIRQICKVGETGPESFRVEVEATHKLETISRTNLALRT